MATRIGSVRLRRGFQYGRRPSRRRERRAIYQSTESTMIDTWISELNPDTAAANGLTIGVRTTTGSNQNGLLYFDLTQWAGWTVEAAWLVLFNSSAPAIDRFFELYGIKETNAGWTEAATYNYAVPSTQRWHGDGGADGGSDAGCTVEGQDFDSIPIATIQYVASSGAGQKHVAELALDTVQAWIDGDNYGCLMKTIGAGATGAFSWHSSNAANAAFRPYIQLRLVRTSTIEVVTEPIDENLAFPGAIGYGRYVQGGKGGQVLHVTTLDDYAAGESVITGSLRWALNIDGPRIIVFDIGGTIELKRQLNVSKPYVTIAGQTAPGGGICLKNAATNMDSPISWRTFEIIICGVRSRPSVGGTSVTGSPRYGDAIDAFGNPTATPAVHSVYMVHCSGSWSVDELCDFYRSSNITIEKCLFSEPLNLATHSYTGTLAPIGQIGHAKHMLLSNTDTANITVSRCAFLHGMDRHPEASLSSGTLDLINNVFYNWGTDVAANGGRDWVTLLTDHYGNWNANVVGCYYKPGPNSANRDRIRYNHPSGAVGDTLTVYLSGNTDTSLGAISTVSDDGGAGTLVVSGTPLGDVAYGTPLTATQAYDWIRGSLGAGASYRLDNDGAMVANRDSVDTRVLGELAAGTGAIISQGDAKIAWPSLAAGTALDWNEEDVPVAYAAANPGADIHDFIWSGL